MSDAQSSSEHRGGQPFDINEAVEFLQRLHPDITISKDTLYHKVIRGQIPATKQDGRYIITESALLAANFRRKRLPGEGPSKPQTPDWSKVFGGSREYWENFQPVEIHTDEDMKKLVAVFDELVDGEGLRQLLYQKYHVWYSLRTIKQRRYRGSLLAVGKSGSERVIWWYPKKQLGLLSFRPQLVKNNKHA